MVDYSIKQTVSVEGNLRFLSIYFIFTNYCQSITRYSQACISMCSKYNTAIENRYILQVSLFPTSKHWVLIQHNFSIIQPHTQ